MVGIVVFPGESTGGGGTGPAGPAGVGVSTATINGSGHLIVTLTNGATVDAGSVVGPKGDAGAAGPAGSDGADGAQGQQGAPGAAGADGVSVISATVNGSGHLIVTLSTGATIDAGYVVGPQGAAGSNGTNGSNGVGVPSGGTTGQILAKKSAADHDTEWVAAPTGGGGGAEMRRVLVTLSANQTVSGASSSWVKYSGDTVSGDSTLWDNTNKDFVIPSGVSFVEIGWNSFATVSGTQTYFQVAIYKNDVLAEPRVRDNPTNNAASASHNLIGRTYAIPVVSGDRLSAQFYVGTSSSTGTVAYQWTWVEMKVVG